MARALNQTMAWVIAGGISISIFGTVVGLMLSNKGHETHENSSHDGDMHTSHSEQESGAKHDEEHNEKSAEGSVHEPRIKP